MLLILAASLALITATDSGFFEQWENRTWDIRQQFTANADQADTSIKLVLIDQRSIDQIYEQYGYSWPFPRKLFAEALSYLAQSGARGVAFDHVFTDPSIYGPDDDRSLASLKTGATKIVHAFSPQPEERLTNRNRSTLGERIGNALELPKPYLRAATRRKSYRAAAMPIPDIISSSDLLGAVIAEPDSDGIIRRYQGGGLYLFESPGKKQSDGDTDQVSDAESDDFGNSEKKNSYQSDLATTARGWPFLSLSFALYRAVAGEAGWKSAEGIIPEASPLLSFHGPSGSYPSYSFSDVVRSANLSRSHASPTISPAEFENSWVFVGVWAPGLMDRRFTPLDRHARAVDIHATALDNLIHRNFAQKASKASSFLIAFLFLSMAIMSAILSRHLSVQLFGFAASTIGLIGIALYAASNGIWIELFGPLVIQTLAVITALAYEYAVEGRDHRFIKHAFRHYVSPELIDSIVENPTGLALGGERRELTMFFSDIVGFIAISEKLEPAEEAKLLNEYLSLCAGTILERKGTVDKFVGDGIVAFWNAPVHEPNHALLAVETAVEIQRRLEPKQELWRQRYGSELKTRIGLHTGTVSVGNFGTDFRFSYTVIGDAANLASRLEGANKVFGTSIIVSGATRDLIGDKLRFRRLGKVRVAGREEAVETYEPLDISSLNNKEDVDLFESSLRLFEAGDLASAQKGFLKLSARDSASAAYLKRLEPVQSRIELPIQYDHWNLAVK